jgi:hypothetical protein
MIWLIICLGNPQERIYPVIPAYAGSQHQSCLVLGIVFSKERLRRLVRPGYNRLTSKVLH